MVSANEFSHIVKLIDIGAGVSSIKLAADAPARSGLMARFDLAALDMLKAELSLSRSAKGVLAQGSFRATLAQYCVATGDPVPVMLDEPVNIRFVTEPTNGVNVEIELDADDCDSMFHNGQSIDLGEAVAQSLGLALNPYPRRANAPDRMKAAGVKSEDEVEPVGALAGLKDMLARK